MIPLREEIGLLESYLYIQDTRLKGKLCIEMQVLQADGVLCIKICTSTACRKCNTAWYRQQTDRRYIENYG